MYKNRHRGFTMIELVFVIVVLGILAAIAIPRFAATRDDAHIAKGRSDVAAIRAGIMTERQSRLLKGETNYTTSLEGNDTTVLFDKVMQYGIASGTGNGQWSASGNTYTFKVMGISTSFDYNSTGGTFKCSPGSGYCDKLTQ